MRFVIINSDGFGLSDYLSKTKQLHFEYYDVLTFTAPAAKTVKRILQFTTKEKFKIIPLTKFRRLNKE
jgi:hypothetical protein